MFTLFPDSVLRVTSHVVSRVSIYRYPPSRPGGGHWDLGFGERSPRVQQCHGLGLDIFYIKLIIHPSYPL